MKTLRQIREEIEINETEDKKLTTLIRAGLFDIHKLPLLKRALSKDNTKMSASERNSLLDLLDTLISHVTGDNAIYSKVKRNVMAEENVNEAYEIAGELPMILILKRRSIRSFPDGQRVALYWADKLKTFISVPYSSAGVGYSQDVSVAEEVELVSEEVVLVSEDDIEEAIRHNDILKSLDSKDEISLIKAEKAAISTKDPKKIMKAHFGKKDVKETLEDIVHENTQKILNFKDGGTTTISPFTASAILEVYNAINDDNKAKMKASLNESKVSFMKMVEFALSKV